MISLLVMLILGVCCHTLRYSLATFMKRREQKELKKMTKQNIELTEEFTTRNCVLEYRVKDNLVQAGKSNLVPPSAPAGSTRGSSTSHQEELIPGWCLHYPRPWLNLPNAALLH